MDPLRNRRESERERERETERKSETDRERETEREGLGPRVVSLVWGFGLEMASRI